MESTILNLIISIIVSIVIIAPALWISGRMLVGKNKAKFTDAIWIVTLGTLISSIVSYFFGGGIIVSILMLIIILGLVKHFFDCGWIKALLISIVALIIFIIIAAILALLGIGIIALAFI
jgi:hypothetical protein